METLKDYIRLLHLPTLILITLFQVLMYFWVITPSLRSFGVEPTMPTIDILNLILSTFFIAAGAFVINDYFDLKIDEINRPLTRVVGKRIEKKNAMSLYMVLTGVGVILSLFLCWHARSIDYALMMLFITGILWFYSSSYKRILFLGNFIVAFLMGFALLSVAIFENRFMFISYKMSPDLSFLMNENLTQVLLFSLLAFSWTLIIEITKDLASQKGDRELECHTFPVVLGNKKTKWIIYGLISLIMLSFGWTIYQIPSLQNTLSIRLYCCFTIIPSLSLFYIFSKAQTSGDYRIITKYLLAILALNILYSYVFLMKYE